MKEQIGVNWRSGQGRVFRAAFWGLVLAAAVAVANADAPKVDPDAARILADLSAAYRGANAFRVDVETVTRVTRPGIKQEMTAAHSVAVRRPNRLALLAKADTIGSTLVCDGTRIHWYNPIANRYAVSDRAPATVTEALGGTDAARAMGVGTGGAPMLAALFADDPLARMLEGVLEARHLGVERIDGDPCECVEFRQSAFRWTLWVRIAKPTVVRRIRIDIESAGAPAAGAAHMKMKTVVDVGFQNWVLDPDLPDETFRFNPPPGSTIAPDETRSGADAGLHALHGKPAPDFELAGLDGGRVKGGDAWGKGIVVLDFWATWCGPCVRALPVLARVAERYRDKGVLFYAINQREDATAVRRFLEKNQLAIPVLLDHDGAVGARYGVTGIPQTVLVDKGGVVRAVHVGLLPDLDAQLGKELDELLSGRGAAAAASTGGKTE